LGRALRRAADRDRANRTLRVEGWRVLRIWEHELTKQNERRLLARLRRLL
jgi:DNA mismatch endonuclease (patch repair protein)